MPRYTYTAKVTPGKDSAGFVEAESEADAVNKLAAMGLFPLTVRYETPLLGASGGGVFRKVSRREVAAFTRQLSTLIDSGVNLLQALRIVSEQGTNKALSAVVRDVSDRIRDGKPLSESLAAFPALFSRLYCALVHAGEASGGLSVALRRLADYMEEDEELRNSLKASLTYPLFVSAVSAATVAVLVGFVVPRLADLLSDMGQALPLPTRVLVGFSGFISAWWWLLLAAGAAAVIAAIRFYLSDRGRLLVDEYILRLPFWGEVALKSEVARFMRTLSLLLSSGQAITLSLEISSSVLENSILKREIRGFKDQVIAGTSLSQAVAGSRYMPRMAVNVISIGEEAGSLDKSLSRIASEYEKECDRTMKAAVRLLEPSVILVMGLVVGFIVIAMLLPIFQINLIVR